MKRPFNGSRARRNIERLLEVLAESPRTHGEVRALLHMSDRNATVYLSHLRNSTPKQAFILRWDRVERGHSPVFALGSRMDAPRPKRQTMAQISQKRRERWRKNPEIHDQYLARERARKQVEKAKAKPTTWLSALM